MGGSVAIGEPSKEGVMVQNDLFILLHEPWNAGQLIGA